MGGQGLRGGRLGSVYASHYEDVSISSTCTHAWDTMVQRSSGLNVLTPTSPSSPPPFPPPSLLPPFPLLSIPSQGFMPANKGTSRIVLTMRLHFLTARMAFFYCASVSIFLRLRAEHPAPFPWKAIPSLLVRVCLSLSVSSCLFLPLSVSLLYVSFSLSLSLSLSFSLYSSLSLYLYIVYVY